MSVWDKRNRHEPWTVCARRRALQASGVDIGPPRVRMAINIRRVREMRCIVQMIWNGQAKVKFRGTHAWRNSNASQNVKETPIVTRSVRIALSNTGPMTVSVVPGSPWIPPKISFCDFVQKSGCPVSVSR